MTKDRLLNILKFPSAWIEYDLYPEDLLILQINELKLDNVGNVVVPRDTEHFRYAAFAWWLNRNPSFEVLDKLEQLAILDPDIPMGRAIVREINGLRKTLIIKSDE
jgi:hypothetical protein